MNMIINLIIIFTISFNNILLQDENFVNSHPIHSAETYKNQEAEVPCDDSAEQSNETFDEEIISNPDFEVFPEYLLDEITQYTIDSGNEWKEEQKQDEYLSIINDDGRLGNMGRLYIPSADISVALFYFTSTQPEAQAKCDEWDAAVFVPWHDGQPYIGDHSNQEFATLRYCSPGDYAYIKTSDSITKFQCIEATEGYNLDYDLIRWDNVKFEDLTDSDFIAYTCNGNWQNILIARFKQIENIFF